MALTISTMANNQLSGLPTKNQVSEKIETYSRILNESKVGFPSGLQLTGNGLSIGEAVPYPPTGKLAGVWQSRNDLTVQMLEGFGKEFGYKLPKELKDGLTGIDKSFVFDLADTTISDWVNRGSEMMNVASAAAGKVQGYGLEAIKIGTMTVEAARSGGYVSDAETMNIAMTAGASAGGIIGSILPGIGTAIGTVIGTAVGALIGSIVGAFTRPDFAGTERAMKQEAQAALLDLKRYCGLVQDELNSYIFSKVFEISTKWVNAERTLGYRFPLRWFDANPGLRFEGAAQQGAYLQNLLGNGFAPSTNTLTPKSPQDGFDYPFGRFHCQTEMRQRQGRIDYLGKEYRSYGTEITGVCNFYCPEKILGCLYPTPAINEFHGYGSPRVVAAFYSRGFNIPASLNCASLRPVTDEIKGSNYDGWGKKGPKGERAERDYQNDVEAAIKRSFEKPPEQAQTLAGDFEVTARLISTDLTRTIALMQSKQSILLNRVELTGEGIFSDVALRFAGARNQHIKHMNMIALAGGATLLGAALWKGFR